MFYDKVIKKRGVSFLDLQNWVQFSHKRYTINNCTLRLWTSM